MSLAREVRLPLERSRRKETGMDRITPCLWFDTRAIEAMLQMRKIVIDELERAADGVAAG